nr:unnamed protein product [Digitaria exilis]
METAITAVAGELLSRFISFTINKFCSSYVCSEKEERLQHLLMRAHTVVEEADGRHISNSGMLMQLKVLSEAMYQGYHALDTLRFQLRDECMDKVSDSFSISSATRLKRRRTILSSVNRRKVLDLDVHGALKTLETVMSNIAEFVVLLDEDAPAVLPIIGGLAVGKKTLVAHSFAPLIVIGIAQVIGIRESNELSV